MRPSLGTTAGHRTGRGLLHGKEDHAVSAVACEEGREGRRRGRKRRTAKVGRILGLVALFGSVLGRDVVVLDLVNDGVLKVDSVRVGCLSDASDAVGFRRLLEDEFRVELPELFGRVFAGLGEEDLFPTCVYVCVAVSEGREWSGGVPG